MRWFSWFLTSLVCLLPLLVHAEPDTLWTARISISDLPIINSATELSNGDFAVVGTCMIGTNKNIFVARLAPNGSVSWVRQYGSDQWNENGNAVVQLPDSSLFVIGNSGNATPRCLMVMGVSPAGDSLWSSCYGVEGVVSGNDGILLRDGNIAVLGYKLGTDQTRSDMWLVKFTPAGDTLWSKLYGAMGTTETGSRILPRASGGFLMAGQTGQSATTYDMWMILSDSLGNASTSLPFEREGLERTYGAFITSDAIYLAGRSQTAQDNDGYVLKANLAGALQWAQPYTENLAEEQLHGIVPKPDGNLLCVGWAGATGSTTLPWIVTIRPTDGAVIDSWRDATVPMGMLNGVIPLRSDGYLMYGCVYGNDGIQRAYVMRVRVGAYIAGALRDAQTSAPRVGITVRAQGRIDSCITDANGHYALELPEGIYSFIVRGPCVTTDTFPGIQLYADSILQHNFDLSAPSVMLAQTSINVLAENHRTGTAPLYIYNTGLGPMSYAVTTDARYPRGDWLTVEPASGMIEAGDSVIVEVRVSPDTTDTGTFDFYGWLTVHNSSCPDSAPRLPVLAVVLDAPAVPAASPYAFGLSPAYPNPFNPSAMLTFTLPRDGYARLVVYDIRGRISAVLADDRFAAGQHRVTFDGSALPSGVYFARLESNGQRAVSKLMLLK